VAAGRLPGAAGLRRVDQFGPAPTDQEAGDAVDVNVWRVRGPRIENTPAALLAHRLVHRRADAGGGCPCALRSIEPRQSSRAYASP